MIHMNITTADTDLMDSDQHLSFRRDRYIYRMKFDTAR